VTEIGSFLYFCGDAQGGKGKYNSNVLRAGGAGILALKTLPMYTSLHALFLTIQYN